LLSLSSRESAGRYGVADIGATGATGLSLLSLNHREQHRTMVVCNCFNVRERDLAELANEGRCCLRSVRQATGLGTNCGKCIPQARAVISAQKPALLTSVDLGATMEIRA
jgi:bacterioferritin-associated ferredoxin